MREGSDRRLMQRRSERRRLCASQEEKSEVIDQGVFASNVSSWHFTANAYLQGTKQCGQVQLQKTILIQNSDQNLISEVCHFTNDSIRVENSDSAYYEQKHLIMIYLNFLALISSFPLEWVAELVFRSVSNGFDIPHRDF